jgi:CheY-like chemotaxis protein
MTKGAEFVHDLREALNHLYNPEGLRQSPLIDLLGVDRERFDAPANLQRLLVEAIDAIKPEDGTQPNAPGWRVYELLFYRYVQQCSQQEVADQLGVSVRQLRREQNAALETLAYELWESHGLEQVGDSKGLERTEPGSEVTEGLDQELAWLSPRAPDVTTDLWEAIPPVLSLTAPMAAEHGVRVVTALPSELPHVVAHPMAVRQILLSLLCLGIPRANAGFVELSAEVQRWEAIITLSGSAQRTATDGPLTADEAANLRLSRRLARLSGGRLDIERRGSSLVASLALPAQEQIPVLFVDDNADALQLLRRYTSGTRYRAMTLVEPADLLEMAEAQKPAAVVLDVMMPEVDGWELIGRLRQHPPTSEIPVIVCSILAQAELAASLGVNAYLRKPVSRHELLATLDQQVRAVAPEGVTGSH